MSDNFYWIAAKESDYRLLGKLGQANLIATAAREGFGSEGNIRVQLKNQGQVPALEIKLIPENAETGERLLPAYLSDNYISLVPGETRTIAVSLPKSAHAPHIGFGIRGWNTAESQFAVQ